MDLKEQEGGRVLEGAAIEVVLGRGRNGSGGRICPRRRREVRYLTSILSSSPTPNQMVSGGHISKPLSRTVLLMVARSVQNKTALIHDVILDEGADLACITETWVGEEGGGIGR